MNTGHILATEIADYLAMKGVPFREAHEQVGQLVQLAEDNQCQYELSIEQQPLRQPLKMMWRIGYHLKQQFNKNISLAGPIQGK